MSVNLEFIRVNSWPLPLIIYDPFDLAKDMFTIAYFSVSSVPLWLKQQC